MAVPEDVSCVLQVVSEYLKEPCPITSLGGSQGPTHTEGLKHVHGGDTEGKGRREAHQVRRFTVLIFSLMLEALECKS